MYNLTDYLACGILFLGLLDGWRVGFLRALLTPACFFFFCVIGVINFDLNQNIATSLFVLFAGTVGSSTLLRILLFALRRYIDKDYQDYIFWGSRLLGAIISTAWKGALFAIGILAITLLPSKFNPQIAAAQRNILGSHAFFYIYQNLLPRYPIGQNIYLTLSVFKDPAKLEELSSLPEFEDFFQDPKVQALIQDDGVQTFLSTQHYELVLAHPKVQAVINDNLLMKKLMRIGRQIYQEKLKDEPLKN